MSRSRVATWLFFDMVLSFPKYARHSTHYQSLHHGHRTGAFPSDLFPLYRAIDDHVWKPESDAQRCKQRLNLPLHITTPNAADRALLSSTSRQHDGSSWFPPHHHRVDEQRDQNHQAYNHGFLERGVWDRLRSSRAVGVRR